MTKDQSQILKGIAILFMIFRHLFNQMKYVELCDNLIWINGKPLVYAIMEGIHSTPIFLILTGYGLYKAWLKGDKNRWGRLIKLGLHFWFILFVFVTIGHFILPNKYPGNILTVLLNFTGINTSYNGELWFFFPYVGVFLIIPYFFKLIRNIKWYWIISGTLLLHMGSIYMMTRVITYFPPIQSYLYTLCCIPLFFFNVSLGMVTARADFFEKIKTKIRVKGWKKNVLVWSYIVIIFISAFVIPYNFFYSFLLIIGLSQLQLSKIVKNSLYKLGNQSMNMWMIHSWFCYHLFSDFIYSFKYPLIIFVVLTLLSYLLSLAFNIIIMPLEQLFLSKREIKESPIV